MAAKDDGRVYFSALKGSAKKFETEQEVIRFCKNNEGKFFPTPRIDYYYFSDVEEDRDSKGCRKIIS